MQWSSHCEPLSQLLQTVIATKCHNMQVQFHAKGPTGAALISADMYQDDAKQWQWAFLYVDMTSPTPQRLVLTGPSVPQY